MFIFRFFSRRNLKVPPKVIEKNDDLPKQSLIADEFQRYIDEQLNKNSSGSRENITEKLVGSNTLSKIAKALEKGEEIDIAKLDFNFPEELETRLEKLIEEEEKLMGIDEKDEKMQESLQKKLDELARNAKEKNSNPN